MLALCVFRGLAIKWREIKIQRECKGTSHDVRFYPSLGNVDSEEIFALKRKRHTHKAEALSTEWKTMERYRSPIRRGMHPFG